MTRIAIFDPRDGYAGVLALVEANKPEAEAHIPHPITVDLPLYERLYDAGMLVCVGAYDGAQIVGYAIAGLSPSLHYGVLVAQHLTLYITPQHRKPRLSLRMVDALTDACKARGAQMMTWHAKPGSAFARLLAARMKLEDLVYLQEIE